MTLFIIVFGMLTCLTGVAILINPQLVFGFLRKHSDKIALHVLAIVTRLVLGIFLILQSDESRYPLAIEVIGWLSVVSALVFAALGRDKFSRLMAWALSFVKTLGRVGGVVAMAFGAFLVYAFM